MAGLIVDADDVVPGTDGEDGAAGDIAIEVGVIGGIADFKLRLGVIDAELVPAEIAVLVAADFLVIVGRVHFDPGGEGHIAGEVGGGVVAAVDVAVDAIQADAGT